MKRKTLKRKISIVGILVFVSMIVYSCWQDEWSSNVTDEVIFDSNKELTIAKAEQCIMPPIPQLLQLDP